MIVNETQNQIEIKINGEKIEGKKRISSRIKKEVHKIGLKKWKENMEKKNSLKRYKVKKKAIKGKYL